MSASTPLGDSAISPPASAMWNCRANFKKPSKKRFTQEFGKPWGSARDRNAALGSPPIAAMSLSPRVRQRWPTASGGCHSRRKCTPSREKSVVTSASCPCGRRNTAQSSPIPLPIHELWPNPVRRRIFAIRTLSGSGKAKPIYKGTAYHCPAAGHPDPTCLPTPAGHLRQCNPAVPVVCMPKRPQDG
jgi:hypothetical protein